ncbi:MAG: hypothetical protein ACTHMS_11305 [Jatrophihabitans sp.]|uniref:hypothetical protein n=1 Tax=Jatrophihabitans sp. TaxID=1932789 RepID=UPI003F7F244F
MFQRVVVATAAIAVGAAALTACGSSGGGAVASSGNYCSDLKSTAAYFKAFSSNDPTGIDFDKVKSSFNQLASEAPSDVKGDWQQMSSGVSKIVDALDQAGVKISDLKDPSKLSADKLAKLQGVAKTIESAGSSLDAPGARIKAEAKSHCNVELS